MRRDGQDGRQQLPDSAWLTAYRVLCAMTAPLAGLIARRRVRGGSEDPARWRERLGLDQGPPPDRPVLWVHAASVGESLSVLPLLNRVAARRPDLCLLVTTNTVTSAGLMAERLPPGSLHRFLPYDFGPGVARFLDHWRPAAALWVESEFWPRLLDGAARRGVPVILVNARISDRSARRWRRVRGLTRALLARFNRLLAPDEATRVRLLSLGADPDDVAVTGPLKGGAGRLAYDARAAGAVRAALGPRPVWLAASTHPGEDEIVAAAHRIARREATDLALILVPRHPERGPALAEALLAHGFQVSRRAGGDLPVAGADIYLADTVGEMGLWYDLARVVFLGGSLTDVGGHNPYEPTAHRAAILHGPHVSNFRDAFRRLDTGGGAIPVTGAEDLAETVVALLADPDGARALAENAALALAEAGDGIGATHDEVMRHLPAPSSSD
jgi:3-deoxy-D-manno-octulosonic-acid transferase